MHRFVSDRRSDGDVEICVTKWRCVPPPFQSSRPWRLFLYILIALITIITIASCLIAVLECVLPGSNMGSEGTHGRQKYAAESHTPCIELRRGLQHHF